jgi:alkanesulfonate monooxygenase SsuD/methylene tetrahydromethanopterin reductase-like flavin-dependent oxidoreductase (luciferase family)
MATLKEIRKAIRAAILAGDDLDRASIAAYQAQQESKRAAARYETACESIKDLLDRSRVTYRGKLYSVRDGGLSVETVREIKD